jgi:riboflavin-specific deaminase-like protein
VPGTAIWRFSSVPGTAIWRFSLPRKRFHREVHFRNHQIVSSKRKKLARPFVTVKFAQTLDGRIATSTGDSHWISSPASRRFAHKLRSEHEAILVGIGTVLADNPQLTVRLIEGRDPRRVIVDTRLRIPLDSEVLNDASAKATIVAAAPDASRTLAARIRNLGAKIIRVPANQTGSGIDLTRLLEELAALGIKSVLVEGGNRIITSLLAARTVDRVVAFVAPKIIGAGTDTVGDLGIRRISEAITFSSITTRKLGGDVMFDALLK